MVVTSYVLYILLTEYGMTFYKEVKSDFDVIQNK